MLKATQLTGFNVSSRYPRITYDGQATASDVDTIGFNINSLDLSAASMDCFVLAVAFAANTNITFDTLTLNSEAFDGSIVVYDNNQSDKAGCGIFWWLSPALINPCPLSVSFSDTVMGTSRKLFGLSGVNQSTPTVVTASSNSSGSAAKSISLDTTTGSNKEKTLIIGARALARGITGVSQSPTSPVSQVAQPDGGVDEVNMFVGKCENVRPSSFSFQTTATATPTGDAMVGVAFRS